MKYNHNIKTLLTSLLLGAMPAIAMGETVGVFYNRTTPQHAFAAGDIKAALEAEHFQVKMEDLSALNKACTGKKVVITLASNLRLTPLLRAQGGHPVTRMGEQAYALRTTTTLQTSYWILGGDDTGAMYGGLQIAENIQFHGFGKTYNEQESPYIKERGLKFNIPLDIRTPSYQDAGDAAQNNIAEMWNFEFWREYFDAMARHRYNVLTLWNPHPFPSMIELEDYPDIALQDVCGTAFPLDTDRPDEASAKFIAGCGVSEQVLDNLIILKKMTMAEKITFWRKVMSHARDRGIDLYFITWNVKVNSVAPPGWYRQQQLKMGDKGKYGINNDQENPRTIQYLRESVKQFLLTYPDVAGIGITAGENMESRDDEFDKEKWLWAAYGQGVVDFKKLQPDREVKFIHRHWETSVSKMMDDFIGKYPDEINLSFKYARARMYATPNPRWCEAYVEKIKPHGLKSWWNIRNDDIFHFRWGDPVYARDFIKNLPPEEVTAGYYMGSDGYVWGRESISKHPNTPRDLEIHKHWFNFMLWGRLGYNPDLSQTRIKAILHHRFPDIAVDQLYTAWTHASRVIAQVNRFHWKSWDFMWAVEGCLDLEKGFHTVIDFIETPPMEGSGILSIPDYVKRIQADQHVEGITPLSVAEQLDSYGDTALAVVSHIRDSDLVMSKELSETLYDIQALSYLGKYYAAKIRGGIHLHAFQTSGSHAEKDHAIRALETALERWKAYAYAATCNYRPQFMAKTRTIDWIKLTDDVRRDIDIAKRCQ